MARGGRGNAPDPRRNANLAPVAAQAQAHAAEELQEVRAEIERVLMAEVQRRQLASIEEHNRASLRIMHMLANPRVPRDVKNALIATFVRNTKAELSDEELRKDAAMYGGNEPKWCPKWVPYVRSVLVPSVKVQFFLLVLQLVIFWVGGFMQSFPIYRMIMFTVGQLIQFIVTVANDGSYIPLLMFYSVVNSDKLETIINYFLASSA